MKNQDLNELYLKHEKSLKKVANKYLRAGEYYGYTFEDLLSIQHLAFMQAVETYNEDKGMKFNTYLVFLAQQKIENEFKSLRDQLKKKANVGAVSIYTPADSKSDNVMELPILNLREKDPYKELETKEIIDKIFKLVKHRSGAETILKMKMEGYSDEEIANKLNINKKAMQKRFADIKTYLKKHMEIEHY